MSEVDVDDYDASIVVGMFLDVPPPGSKQFECEDCEREITLGPTQQKLMAAKPNHTFHKMCMPCVLLMQAEAAQKGDDMSTRVYRAKDAL